MDGNGRYGQKLGKIRLFGHRQGAKAVSRTVEAAARLSIKTLTLFAFSSENWKRPKDEVDGLMELFAQVLQSERARLHKNGIKVRFVGELSRFSPELLAAIRDCEELTCHKGIGRVKCIQLSCIFELSKRLAREHARLGLEADSPRSVADFYMAELKSRSETSLLTMSMFSVKETKCSTFLISNCPR